MNINKVEKNGKWLKFTELIIFFVLGSISTIGLRYNSLELIIMSLGWIIIIELIDINYKMKEKSE